MKSISTVNVINFADQCCTVNSMISFPDTLEGCEAAQQVFKNWVIEAAGDNAPSNDDLEDAIDAGRFEVGGGFIIIVHSTFGEITPDDAARNG